MKLITIDAYCKKAFAEGSQPHQSTVRRWIASGQLRGRVIGGTYYVAESELYSTGNDLADSILKVS
ncbi:helix-turn-helix domain-containing protein [Permianibacter sp. IMCC34836]|uniref:helix-turn-helix domain-containing protein n=1 Tax=Permianibacter fluminis TaxID=2738515 RepID=UPI001555EBDB|nr:helix-turn-helix domain-containing protein [Permianibacter fluminis]NQD37436.1 helix-turn-helix domain-containing protein [Permianibacter fluminis]